MDYLQSYSPLALTTPIDNKAVLWRLQHRLDMINHLTLSRCQHIRLGGYAQEYTPNLFPLCQ